jgi:CRP/FNR family transcriptional regulator, nitrogen oxide reductase regulator
MQSIPPSLSAAIQLLKNFPLFKDLSEADLADLAGQVRFAEYERDEPIFHQGDPCEQVWLLDRGQVKIVYLDLDGREVILEIISPGEAFGGGVLFFPQQPATAVAMEASLLASLSSENYARFLLDHPQVNLRLIKMLGARHLSMINMQILAGERVERRMAHILFKLATRVGCEDPEGTLISIPLSRQDLADMACTTLETAIRTLSRFTRGGLVHTRRGGYLVVKDLAELQKLTL